jgi:lysophospholipase L1-like esterase
MRTNSAPNILTTGTASPIRKISEYSKFAASHDGIYVVDLYGALADGNGNLRPGYAVSSDDSHLSRSGYDAITPELMDAIAQAKAG